MKLDPTLWPAVGLCLLLVIAIFHKPLKYLGRLLLRCALALGFLFAWSQSGLLAGLALGVNAFNALALGLLGIPGLGLLLLLKNY